MNSQPFRLVDAVLAELGRPETSSQSHKPFVAPDVAPDNPLIQRVKATRATRATSGRVGAEGEDVFGDVIGAGEKKEENKNGPVQYSSQNVAFVALVAPDVENKRVFRSHKELRCGSCGSGCGSDGSGSAGCRHAGGDDVDPAALVADWRAGVARASQQTAPPGISDREWGGLLRDAARLTEGWGLQLARLGWTTLDLFALHRARPMVRVDHAGLVRLMDGFDVLAVTTTSATLRSRAGATQTYVRRTATSCDWSPMWAMSPLVPISTIDVPSPSDPSDVEDLQ